MAGETYKGLTTACVFSNGLRLTTTYINERGQLTLSKSNMSKVIDVPYITCINKKGSDYVYVDMYGRAHLATQLTLIGTHQFRGTVSKIYLGDQRIVTAVTTSGIEVWCAESNESFWVMGSYSILDAHYIPTHHKAVCLSITGVIVVNIEDQSKNILKGFPEASAITTIGDNIIIGTPTGEVQIWNIDVQHIMSYKVCEEPIRKLIVLPKNSQQILALAGNTIYIVDQQLCFKHKAEVRDFDAAGNHLIVTVIPNPSAPLIAEIHSYKLPQ